MEKPPIRILQRPCQPSDDKISHIRKPPTTFKTLEQREADYAAARRRIMESEDFMPDEDDKSNESTKTMFSGTEGSPARQVNTPTGVTVSATPLMSIPASPVTVNTMQSECGLQMVAPAWANNGNLQSRTMNGVNVRQGYAVVNVPQKLQQQPQHSTTMGRTAAHPQRLLTASASSPSFFNPRTTTQPVPLFPSHNNATNAGLLPTPPGFNYSMQNATLNGSGSSGMHHSHSAAYTLMQTFGLFQQQYQQALVNGFHGPASISSSIPHSAASLNPFTFSSVASQSNCNQKYTHPSQFN